MSPRLEIRRARWAREAPLGGEIETITAELRDGSHTGRGEVAAFDEASADTISAQLAAMAEPIAEGLDRHALQSAMSAGPARCALDFAFWELEAKQRDLLIWDLLEIVEPRPLVTSYRLAAGEPAQLPDLAAAHSFRPLLRIDLAGEDDLAGLDAVARAAPSSSLIVTLRGEWPAERIAASAAAFAGLRLAFLEWEGAWDPAGAELPLPIALRADADMANSPYEAGSHEAGSHEAGPRRRFMSLDLTRLGGLTSALALRRAPWAEGLEFVVEGGQGTSLAMAPAHVLAQGAAFAHLDGPLHLLRDRQPGLRYEGSRVYPPKLNLWG